MPTPSSNAPDPQSPRSYPFSSCPDPEDQSFESQTISQPSIQSDPESPSQSPPSWSTRDPPPYSTDVELQASSSLEDDAVASRSITMSPGPQSDRNFDIVMRREPEGMVLSQDHIDESHKQAGEEEDMLAVDTQHSSPESRNEADAEVNTRTAASTSTLADGALNRRRQKAPEMVSPITPEELDEIKIWESTGTAPRWVEDSGLVGMGYEYSHRRVIPTSPSSYLRPGSRFTGTQQSERQRYEVQVEIKHVDMRESFLCGYLRIQGSLDPPCPSPHQPHIANANRMYLSRPD